MAEAVHGVAGAGKNNTLVHVATVQYMYSLVVYCFCHTVLYLLLFFASTHYTVLNQVLEYTVHVIIPNRSIPMFSVSTPWEY